MIASSWPDLVHDLTSSKLFPSMFHYLVPSRPFRPLNCVRCKPPLSLLCIFSRCPCCNRKLFQNRTEQNRKSLRDEKQSAKTLIKVDRRAADKFFGGPHSLGASHIFNGGRSTAATKTGLGAPGRAFECGDPEPQVVPLCTVPRASIKIRFNSQITHTI